MLNQTNQERERKKQKERREGGKEGKKERHTQKKKHDYLLLQRKANLVPPGCLETVGCASDKGCLACK